MRCGASSRSWNWRRCAKTCRGFLRRVGLRTPALVPWVWGLNGVFSVLGSALVIVVSMQAGFTAALAGAALLYALAAAVSGRLWKRE